MATRPKRIVQIMPADPQWLAVFADGGAADGIPLVAWALVEEDDPTYGPCRFVEGMTAFAETVDFAEEMVNFLGYAHRGDAEQLGQYAEQAKRAYEKLMRERG